MITSLSWSTWCVCVCVLHLDEVHWGASHNVGRLLQHRREIIKHFNALYK